MNKALTDAGWTGTAIEQVMALNDGWFEMLFRDAPDSFGEQLRCLKRLGNRPRVMDFLNNFPETAGLLATADDPEELVEILDTEDDRRNLIIGLLMRHVGRRDIAALTAALKGNRDLVCQLIQRGLMGAEVLLIFPRAGGGSDEHERWLQENLANRLAGTDDDLASFTQFVLLQGRDLLEHLNKDREFRERFRSELWPKLVRGIERRDEALEFYMDEPYLWPFLALDRGEELLERRGLLPVALLFGPDAYPKEFQDRAIAVLLSGDGVTFQALTEGRFRKETLFRKLLKRPLSATVLAAALNKLFEQGANYRPLLEKYNQFSDEILAEEVGPAPDGAQTWLPFYTHYMIARKWSQGRDPAQEEYIDAAWDTAVDLAGILFPPAKVGKLLTQPITRVGASAAKKRITQAAVELGMKTARKRLTQKAAQQLAKAGMERQARKWAVTGMVTEMQTKYRSMTKVIEKSSSFEITQPVRFFYQHSNVGRESFKRITTLDARLFMRGDAKVFVHVDQVACAQAKGYLNSWLKDETENALAETRDDQSWKRHVSAWWLLNTGDQVPSNEWGSKEGADR